MNSRHIKHISSSLYKKLQQSIYSIRLNYSIDEIHKFRVTYKKLRAFFRMLSLKNDTARSITASKNLKKLYTLLGKIRNLQLQQQRISATNKNPKRFATYIHLLQQQIDILKPPLLKLLTNKTVIKSKNKTVTMLPKKYSPKEFQKFAQQKWQHIHTILASGNFSDKNIHNIRKQLKDLLYSAGAEDSFKNQLIKMPVWKGRDAAYFTALTNELGIFLDKCAAVTLLGSRWLKPLNKRGQKQLELLKKIWAAEKLAVKKTLVDQLKADLH